MAIYAQRNLYTGINPHLNSILQTPGADGVYASWRGFHGHYIARIMEVLNAQLPEGYVAVNEQSLQVIGEEEGGTRRKEFPVPDVSLFQRNPSQTSSGVAVLEEPSWEAALSDTLVMDEELLSVHIYQQGAGDGLWGRLVTRIELLSPSNKPGGSNDYAYNAKRYEALQTGIPLVEIDLLHERPSPLVGLPVYPQQENSHPYSIAVSDPRPSFTDGRARVFGFDVDQPVPTLYIPLADQERFPFNFGDPYQQAYESGPWGRLVNYAQEPPCMNTYSLPDQQAIRTRMKAIAAEGESNNP
ncbi:MAG: DUF4058 family protein [bacterium]|nr:DUF4058 family protein [bacterium]